MVIVKLPHTFFALLRLHKKLLNLQQKINKIVFSKKIKQTHGVFPEVLPYFKLR